MNAFRLIPASPVGVGIANAMFASARRDEPESPEAWVFFCVTAAEEAHAAVLDNPPPPPDDGDYNLYDEMQQAWDAECAKDGGPPSTMPPRLRKPLSGTELKAAARVAASFAFRVCMPKITGRRNTQAYIACVAAGVGRGYLMGSDAKAMLYTAQLALSAYPSRRAKRGK